MQEAKKPKPRLAYKRDCVILALMSTETHDVCESGVKWSSNVARSRVQAF